MKIIELVCPNCGAKLHVNSDQKIYVCNYCKTDILLDDEVIKVEHTLKNQMKDEKLKIAITYLEDFNDYDKALHIFEELSELYPYEAIVWFYLIRCITRDFTNFDLDEYGYPVVEIEKCQKYFDRYYKVEKDSIQKQKNNELYNTYIIKLNKFSSDKLKDLEKEKNRFNVIVLLFAIIILSILCFAF